ncbi:MAG: bifunctional ADP-heptose synthase [Bacteroidota bacterium]
MGQNPFSTFKDKKILIIGDLMLDAYWYGNVDRISPEAPVPVVNIDQKENRLGGSANVALNILPFGATPVLCGVIGVDESAHDLLDQLNQYGLSDTGIIQSKWRPTTVKTRIWSKRQQLIRLDTESKADLNESESAALLERIISLADSLSPDVILFQDYNKGVLTLELIAKVLELAKIRNIPTVVDPKDNNFWAYKGVTLFKPNLSEIKRQVKTGSVNDYAILADTAFAKLDNRQLLITLSEKGIYFNDQLSEGVIPANIRDVADVCGAGDTVVSVAALGLASNWPLKDIAILSNLAGGLVCEEVGVVPVDPERLAQEYLVLVEK